MEPILVSADRLRPVWAFNRPEEQLVLSARLLLMTRLLKTNKPEHLKKELCFILLFNGVLAL